MAARARARAAGARRGSKPPGPGPWGGMAKEKRRAGERDGRGEARRGPTTRGGHSRGGALHEASPLGRHLPRGEDDDIEHRGEDQRREDVLLTEAARGGDDRSSLLTRVGSWSGERTAAPPGSPRGGSPRRASAHLDRAVPLPPALLEALEVRLVLALFLRPEGRTAHGRLRARGRARSSSPRPGGRGFPQRARIGTQPAAGAAGISNPVSKKFGFPSVLFQSGQNEGFLFLTYRRG